MPEFKFAEFSAGGGIARAGLGESWECVLANDIDVMKCVAYRANACAMDMVEIVAAYFLKCHVVRCVHFRRIFKG